MSIHRTSSKRLGSLLLATHRWSGKRSPSFQPEIRARTESETLCFGKNLSSLTQSSTSWEAHDTVFQKRKTIKHRESVKGPGGRRDKSRSSCPLRCYAGTTSEGRERVWVDPGVKTRSIIRRQDVAKLSRLFTLCGIAAIRREAWHLGPSGLVPFGKTITSTKTRGIWLR